MNIENQVCTFDQAALIYSYKIRLDTIWWWWKNKETEKECVMHVDKYLPGNSWVKVFPAPTVAELGELFGKYFNWLRIRIDDDLEDHGKYVTRLGQPGLIKVASKMDHWVDYAKTEAQSKMTAFIWLVENGYIEPKDLQL